MNEFVRLYGKKYRRWKQGTRSSKSKYRKEVRILLNCRNFQEILQTLSHLYSLHLLRC